MDDISLEFRASCLSLDNDPFCHESASDEHYLLQTVTSKVFAEQLTCRDAVSCTVFHSAVFDKGLYYTFIQFYLDHWIILSSKNYFKVDARTRSVWYGKLNALNYTDDLMV